LKTVRLIGLWAAPLIFIGVLFYWPLGNIISRGLQADWLAVYFEPATLRAIWFTIWQAAL
jgi:ABC-type Fe3+ transport system permease subunit